MKFKLCLLLLIASNLHSTYEEDVLEKLKCLSEQSAVLLVTLCGKEVVRMTEFPYNLYNLRHAREELMNKGLLWDPTTVKPGVKQVVAQHVKIEKMEDDLFDTITTISFDAEPHPLHVLSFLHDTGDKTATYALNYLWQRAKKSTIAPLASKKIKDLLTTFKVNIDNPGGSVNKVFIIGKGPNYQVMLEK